MSRDYQINGPALVYVKGNVSCGISTLTELGLAADPIQVTYEFQHLDIQVNAWGQVPPEVQTMGGAAHVSMTMVHFDDAVLDVCIRESLGGASAAGKLAAAGTRLGGGVARFAAGNHFIGLNVTGPVQGKPYRFLYSYLAGQPVSIPLGVERKLTRLTWRAIPYTTDPWNGGLGQAGADVWDNTLDT